MEDVGNGNVAIKLLSTKKYCGAIGAQAAVLCNRGEVGPAETFFWVDMGHNQFALYSQFTGAYLNSNPLLKGEVRADRTHVGVDATFSFVPVIDTVFDVPVTIRAPNNLFVAANQDSTLGERGRVRSQWLVYRPAGWSSSDRFSSP